MPPNKLNKRAPADWLVYWRQKQIATALSDPLLDHAGSEQFGKIVPGDTIWVCGLGKLSQLVLIGPLDVARIVSRNEARRMFGEDVWDAKYHVIADPPNVASAREVPLGAIAGELRFVSPRRDRLDLSKSLGRQLQAVRRLTPASGERLRQLWGHQVAGEAAELAGIEAELDSLESLDEKVTRLRRREQALLRKLLFGGSKTGTCAICDATLPIGLLVAAHIKPRSACTEAERRDFENNVVPMCVLGCDALFERGLIVVQAGKVAVRMPSMHDPKLAAMRASLHRRGVTAWKAGRIPYFTWHANSRPTDL